MRSILVRKILAVFRTYDCTTEVLVPSAAESEPHPRCRPGGRAGGLLFRISCCSRWRSNRVSSRSGWPRGKALDQLRQHVNPLKLGPAGDSRGSARRTEPGPPSTRVGAAEGIPPGWRDAGTSFVGLRIGRELVEAVNPEIRLLPDPQRWSVFANMSVDMLRGCPGQRAAVLSEFPDLVKAREHNKILGPPVNVG